MKFSVITTTYNAQNQILKSLKSVYRQTYSDWEYWIIDGGSNDDTVSKVKSFADKDNRIKWISEKDNGIYDAMNKGINMISGEYVIFLGAGDCLYSDSVFDDVEKKLKDQQFDIIYGYVYFDEQGKKTKYKHKINFMYSIRFRPISHQAIFARSDLLKKDLFDQKYKITADQDWIMRQYKKGKKIKYLDIPISIFDMSGVSSDEKSQDIAKREMEQILGKYYPNRVEFYKLLKKIREKVSL